MTVQERERRNEEAEYWTETMKEREMDGHDTESRPRGKYRTSVNNLRGSDLLFHPQLRESRASCVDDDDCKDNERSPKRLPKQPWMQM